MIEQAFRSVAMPMTAALVRTALAMFAAAMLVPEIAVLEGSPVKAGVEGLKV
ncbi:hypothetical protein [Bradyrhizobium sp. dw_78]|uniref:hypothetical protein n=1 Tax=Bradyrhizobium sp. dw_78 TaxID=2719793 RepID=UPI001BD4D070|nr:hypothetical protein [Bradyrhizobium sp. dw_78]